MPRFRPAAFSLTLLSILVFLTLFSTSTFAQASGRKALRPPEGKDQDQEQKRAEWNARGREAPKGKTAAALRLRAHQQKMAMRAHRAAVASAQGTPGVVVTPWVSLGPSPLASDATGDGFQDYNWVSGRATSVLVDPADTTGNTVLVGGAYGGLWKSTNAGSKSTNPDSVTWQPLLDEQPTLAVGAIALQPGNSNVILVGTGETNSSGDSYFGLGILRSTDGGSTWNAITSAASGESFIGVGFSKIAFSTSNTNLVVASTAGDLGVDFGNEQSNEAERGLYYSIDAGATWHRVTLSDSSVPASATGVVYNASAGGSGTFFAAIRRHGIYSSTDGQHFTRLTTQPTTGLASANCPANSNSSACQIYRAEFAVTPGRNETYVWVVDSQGGEVDDGIWKTINAGTAWTQISDNGITNCGSGGGGEGPGGTGSGCGVEQGLYNLELAAVPDAADTDLYAGTINVYKCHVKSGTSACSTIDAGVPNDWINLTHVYGCSPLGSLAHVHPDQHGLGFMVVGAKSPGYFAHDGGISRTLDGYLGLDTGSCTGTNQFDSLSQTLGSMTEFVSFSVHPSSPDILLGGTQDNGSPKTSTGTTSTTWQNALSGDGGYNIINPNAGNGGDGIPGDEWFTSQPGSTIWGCEDGAICNDQDAFPEAAPGTGPGGIDLGAFYTPFILDPQDTNEMLIGTCRIWRGDSLQSNFAPISVNFDTGTATTCNGGETNQVAGMDAGGPKDVNGFSNVVYATTWGYGPIVNLPGGEVWTTTNAASGTFTNVTGTINPNHYAISSVAIDRSVSNGQTAFIGIMGFNPSHVWKTTNAGTSWTDWTGSGGTALPNAPVSSLLVDPAAGVIYAGTDVGVFSSSTTGGGSWTEVGPAVGSGPGFLPSAPVTAMRIFGSGAAKMLRVSTYGRGIWEFALATGSATTTTVTSNNNPAVQGTAVTFTATVTTTGANPPTGTVTFNDGGTSIGTGTLSTVSGKQVATLTTSTLAAGSHSITAVYGGDTNNAGSTSTVLTQVINAVTTTTTLVSSLNPANQGVAVTFTATVTTTGTHAPTGTVTFNDGSTSIGSGTLSTVSGKQVATLTSSTLAVGSHSITAVYAGDAFNSGSTSTVLTQVIAAVTTTTTVVSSLNPANDGLAVTFTATVATTGTHAPTGTVTFKDGGTSIGSGNLSTVSGNQVATLTTSTLAVGAHSITAVYGGDTFNSGSTSTVLTETINAPTLSVSTPTTPATILSGLTTTSTFKVTATGTGVTKFAGDVTFACTGLPDSTVTCSFDTGQPDPTKIAAGSTSPVTVTMSVATSGPNQAPVGRRQSPRRADNRSPWVPLTLPLAGIVVAGIAGRNRSKYFMIGSFCLALALLGLLVACGGSSTPAVSVTNVQAAPSSVYPNDQADAWPSQTATFTATVNNDPMNKGVTWAVTTANGGSIDANTGVYTSPTIAAGLPSTVTVTATSVSDPSKSMAGTITLKPATVPGVYTPSVTVTEAGGTPQVAPFTLTVQ